MELNCLSKKFWPKLKVDIVETMWAWAKISWRTPFIPVDGVEGAAIGIDTAATDGKQIWFNLDFMKEYQYDAQGGIAFHEIGHIAMLHPWRRGTRDAEIWNYAADFEMNLFLREYFIHEGRRRWKEQARERPEWKLPDCALINSAYTGWSAETIYDLLFGQAKLKCPNGVSNEKLKEEIRKQIVYENPGCLQQAPPPKAPALDEDGNLLGEGEGEGKGKGEDGAEGGGEGEGEGTSTPTNYQIAEGAKGKPLPQSSDLKTPKNKDGSDMSATEMNDHVQQEMRELSDRLGKITDDSHAAAGEDDKIAQARQWQNQLRIWKGDQACSRPALDVTERVAAWVDASVVTNYSYRKYNRRMGHISEIMHPGKINDSLRFGVICIDTSSSIDKAELDISLKIASNILDRVHMAVKIVSVDSKVYWEHTSELCVGDTPTVQNVAICGGGGTKFEAIFEHYNPTVPNRDYEMQDRGGYGCDILNSDFKGTYHTLTNDDPSVMIFITGDGETSLSYEGYTKTHAPPPWPLLWVVGQRDSPMKVTSGVMTKAVPGTFYESRYRQGFMKASKQHGWGEVIEFQYVLDCDGVITGVR